MNKIEIKGRLVADPVVKETSAGKIATYTLADTPYRDGKPILDADGKNVVQFVDCASKGGAAEKAATLKKGDFVNGVGRLEVSRNKADDHYYVNTTVWVNLYKDKPADKPAAEVA